MLAHVWSNNSRSEFDESLFVVEDRTTVASVEVLADWLASATNKANGDELDSDDPEATLVVAPDATALDCANCAASIAAFWSGEIATMLCDCPFVLPP